MSDIVERLKGLFAPSKIELDALAEITTLRAEVERLKSDRWLGQHGLIPSDYAHAMDCLRAEVERLKAVLEQIIKFADEWEPETQDDYTGLGRMDAAQIARAAIAAGLAAWPMAEMPHVENAPAFIILPLTENPDAEA